MVSKDHERLASPRSDSGRKTVTLISESIPECSDVLARGVRSNCMELSRSQKHSPVLGATCVAQATLAHPPQRAGPLPHGLQGQPVALQLHAAAGALATQAVSPTIPLQHQPPAPADTPGSRHAHRHHRCSVCAAPTIPGSRCPIAVVAHQPR